MKAPAKFNAQLERGYSLRAGSMHQSAESVGTQIGAMSDVAYGKLFHHQIPAWDSPAILNSSDTGRLPMNEHRIFGGLQNEGSVATSPLKAAPSFCPLLLGLNSLLRLFPQEAFGSMGHRGLLVPTS